MKLIALTAAVFSIGLATYAHAQTVQEINLVTNDLIYDPVSAKIYASVPGSLPGIGNSITSIDPATGTVGAFIFVGSEPDKLALSDDGQFLYVGLDGAASIRRFNLATQTPELQFPLGRDLFDGPYFPEDIAVLPGQPHSVAVSRRFLNVTGYNDGVAVYDDGVQRPHAITGGVTLMDSIAFSGSASLLYAQDTESSGNSFTRLQVDSQGVSILDNLGYLITDSIKFDKTSGLIYSASGYALDPEAQTLTGLYAVPNTSLTGYSTRYSVLPDPSHGRVFLLFSNNFLPGVSITSYDATTFRPQGSVMISNTPNGAVYGSNPISSLIKVGDDTLAFRNNNGKVFLIRGLDFPGLASFTLNSNTVHNGGSVTGMITLTRPAPPGGLTVYLSTAIIGSNFPSPSTVTVPAGVTSRPFTFKMPSYLSNIKSQMTQLIAFYGGQSLSVSLNLLDAASDPVLPPNIRVIDLPTNDIIYDKFSQRLYAGIPGTVPGIGNSIARIDPINGNVESSVFVGSEPDKLALSDDGQFLYVGLDGAASIRRFDLATQTPELQFSLGHDTFFGPYHAGQIFVLPGEPYSIAVSLPNPGGAFAQTILYDDATPRPKSISAYDGGSLIAPSSSANRLYGYTNFSSGSKFLRMDVDDTGLTILDTTNNLLFGPDIRYDAGKIYSSYGQVIDPEARVLLGTFPNVSNYGTLVLPASDEGRVYFMTLDSNGNSLLRIDDANTYQQIEALPMIPGVPGIFDYLTSMTRCGTDRLAVRTASGRILLIDASPSVPSSVALTPSSATAGAAVQGTVTLSNVAPVGGLVVSLSSDTPAAASVPASVFVPAGSKSAAFPVTTYAGSAAPSVTITASYNAVNVTTGLTVTRDNTLLQLPNAVGVAGQSVLLRAAVRRFPDGVFLAGKSISFQIDGTTVGSAATQSDDIASLSYSVPANLSTGSHTFSASFVGDAGYNASNQTATLTINVAYDTFVQTGNMSGNVGKPLFLRAVLRRYPDGQYVTGKSVAFQIDGSTVATFTTNSSGLASGYYTLPTSLAAGSHTLKAVFAGGGGFNASSQTATLTVNP